MLRLTAFQALPALNPDFLYAALDVTAYAAFVKESRKKRAGATKLHRKSGEARDGESRFFHGALKRSSPRINAGAPTSHLDPTLFGRCYSFERETIHQRLGQVGFRVSSTFVKFDKIRSFLSFWGNW
jgi:hypothetical protein